MYGAGTIAKIVFGIVLVAVGVWALLPATWSGLALWVELWSLIKGVMPIAIVFVGLMLIWIETEELTVRKKK